MPDMVCPESTIESANRRNFIKQAALVTTAAGIGSAILGRNLIPESSVADSSASVGVTTDTACSNKAGNLAVFNGVSDISGAGCFSKPAQLNGAVPCGFALEVSNFPSCAACSGGGGGISGSGGSCSAGIHGSGGVGVCGVGEGHCCSGGIGVAGRSCCFFGFGVVGYSDYSCGTGVLGRSSKGTGVFACTTTGTALQASSCGSTVAKFINRGGRKNRSMNLQLVNGCTSPITWYEGVGGQGNSHGLTQGQLFFLGGCQPRLVLNKCGKIGIGTTAPNATLQVNGGVSVGTRIVSGNYAMSASDFAVFANAESGKAKITLPAARTTGQIVHIKKIDSSKNAVTIDAAGTDKIEGSSSKTLSAQYYSLTLIAAGNGIWYILSNAT